MKSSHDRADLSPQEVKDLRAAIKRVEDEIKEKERETLRIQSEANAYKQILQEIAEH